jgi:transposase
MRSLTGHYGALLGLDESWNVTGVELSVMEKRVVISLEFVGNGVICPECSARCSLKDHAPEREWRHLDTMQFETVLKARVPRCLCATHGVKTIAVPWADKHSRFTLMFEAFAIDVLVAAGSVKAAACLLGLGWDSTHTIMERAVHRGLAARELDGIRYLGIDEKSFGRGQDYVSVMTDLEESRVLEVVPGRTEEAADLLWNPLSQEQREGLEAVSIDMWQAFENSVRSHAPQAKIVYDTFHIAKYLGEGVDKVRREEHKQLLAAGDDRLTGTRYLWLHHPENMDDPKNDELAALRKQTLKTARAWGLKDYFRWFWTSPDPKAAEKFFDDWYAWAIRSRLEPMKKVARMLKSRLANILTWFQHPISNATSEGFNSRIQAIKSNARGFRSFENYRIRILFFCGKLALKPTNN